MDKNRAQKHVGNEFDQAARNGPVVKKFFKISDRTERMALAGPDDSHIRYLGQKADVEITMTQEGFSLVSNDKTNISRVRTALSRMQDIYKQGNPLSESAIDAALYPVEQNDNNSIVIKTPHKSIYALKPRHADYMRDLRDNSSILGVGPAGTGKTYIAIAQACEDFKNGKVKRIILTRPAVEAGTRLGALPGDEGTKMAPYLIPLFDALNEFLGADTVKRLMETKEIEIAPLNFMRGRTLKDAFIILDEGQNTKPEEMKMFLTRRQNSKVVVTGDPSQCDLPPDHRTGEKPLNGLSDLLNRQKAYLEQSKTPVFALTQFTNSDCVRDPEVAAILDMYEETEQKPVAPRHTSNPALAI